MSAPSPSQPTPEQLKTAIELLEKAVSNRALLAGLSDAEHTRLMKAAGDLYCPDVDQRRRLVKAKVKQRKAAKQQKDDARLHETGIRKLRREKIFTTPNVFPPLDFQQQEVKDNPDFHEAVEPQNCYVCKQDYSQIHHFYDQLCPACAELNWRKRGELADLHGRVALLTGGRVKIGYQAGINSSSPRAFRATRRCVTRRNRISRTGAIAWRYLGWTCATRPAWRRFAAT